MVSALQLQAQETEWKKTLRGTQNNLTLNTASHTTLTDRDENAVDICHKYFHAFSDCHIFLFYLLQVFRTDLITAMKLHDSYQLNPEDYYELADPWRQEWEKGVQVPVSPDSIPQCTVRYEAFFFLPVRLFLFNGCT